MLPGPKQDGKGVQPEIQMNGDETNQHFKFQNEKLRLGCATLKYCKTKKLKKT